MQSWLSYIGVRNTVRKCPEKDASGISDVKIHPNSPISAKRWAAILPKNEKRFSEAFTHQSSCVGIILFENGFSGPFTPILSLDSTA